LEDDISILPVTIKANELKLCLDREDTNCGGGSSKCFRFQIISL